MISGETSGRARQFRGGTDNLMEKGAPFDEFSGSYWEVPQVEKSGLGYDHPDAAAQVTPKSFGLPGSGEDTMLSPGSQPYDPLTNYLSPRPQFLRYNPKRLREIYLRRERELGGAAGDSGSEFGVLDVVGDTSGERRVSGSPLPPSLKQEDGLELEASRDEESYESMDGEEDGTAVEDKPSSCNLVWKILLLLGVLFSVTGYIYSTYSFSTQSSSKGFQSFKENYMKIQGEPQEASGNIGVNLDNHTGTYMNTCINVHFDELASAKNGIYSNSFDKLPKFGEADGEKLQEEGKSVVKDSGELPVDDAKSNANLVIVGGNEWSVGAGDQESEEETQMIVPENSAFMASDKNQNDCSIVGDGESDEYAVQGKKSQHDNMMTVVDDDYSVVDNENLAASVVVMEEENEELISTVNVYDPEHENRSTGDTISGEYAEDLMVETEKEEADKSTPKLNKPVDAPRGETISGHEGKDGSFGNGGIFSFYGMKVLVTVLLVLAVATSTLFSLRRRRDVKPSAKDSSPSFTSSGLASECSSELPSMNEVKKYFDFLNAGKFEVHGNCPSAVELLKGRTVDSFISTDKSKGLYETHPPSVELLSEFSVAGVGFRKTGDSSLAKKTARMNVHHSQSSEISMRNSMVSLEQSPSEISTTESTPQEKPGRKQNNRHKREAEEATSTPLRRSSRIRNRVTTP